MATNRPCLYNRIFQWCEIENQIPTPSPAEDEEQLDLEPEQLTLITQKQQTMPQARGDSLLQLTENHETLIRKASEHAVFVTTVENNSKSPMNPSWTETVLLLCCREYSEPRKSQNSRLQAVLTDHVKIGPATGIEVSKSAGTLVIEVQIPSQQLENEKAWVRKSRGIDQYARQLILTESDHQHPEAVPSQQSMTCWRPRVQETGGKSSVRYKAAPKPKLTSIGLSQRVWNGSQQKRQPK